MEPALTKLPQALQKSLQCWYRISWCAIALALLSMAAIHTMMVIRLHHKQRLLQQAPPTVPVLIQSPEDDVLQKQLDELDALVTMHQIPLQLFEQCINQLPEEIYLTRCIVTAHKMLECSGAAPTLESITEFVTGIHACGLSCTTISTTIDPEKEYPLQFHIIANECVKAL